MTTNKYLKVSENRLSKLIGSPLCFYIVWCHTINHPIKITQLIEGFNCGIGDVSLAYQLLVDGHFGVKYLKKNTTKDGRVTYSLLNTLAKPIKTTTPDGIKEEFHRFFSYDEFQEAWKNWGVVRTKKKTAMTPRSHNQHLKKLVQLSSGTISVMIAMLDQAANNGWTDLYPLRHEVTSHKGDMVSKQYKEYKDT
jgi:hypothetical protein